MDTHGLLRATLDFVRTWIETGGELERTPWGALLRNDRYPRIYMANLAWVERMPRGGVDELLTDLDRVFAGTPVHHRNLIFEDAQVAFENQEAFAAQGFQPLGELAMARVGLPACITNPDVAMREVGADAPEDDYRRLRMRLFEGLGYDPEEARQLYGIARERGAILGEHDYVGYVQGVPAATVSLWCRGSFGFLSDVATMPEFRNRGVARTMIFAASKASINEGCEYSFLVTDLLDFPQAMYKTLGYQPVGEIRSFLRTPAQNPI